MSDFNPPTPPTPPPPAGPTPEPSATAAGAQVDTRRRRMVFIGAAVVVALAIAVGILVSSGGSDEPTTITLRGTFLLFDTGVVGEWDGCSGTGGYDDFSSGMFITVANEEGTKVGGSSLRNLTPDDALWLGENDIATSFIGVAEDDGITDPGTAGTAVIDLAKSGDGLFCLLAFEVEVEPAKIYSVEIGKRGESTYSATDLANDEYFINLSLGG